MLERLDAIAARQDELEALLRRQRRRPCAGLALAFWPWRLSASASARPWRFTSAFNYDRVGFAPRYT